MIRALLDSLHLAGVSDEEINARLAEPPVVDLFDREAVAQLIRRTTVTNPLKISVAEEPTKCRCGNPLKRTDSLLCRECVEEYFEELEREDG